MRGEAGEAYSAEWGEIGKEINLTRWGDFETWKKAKEFR